MIQIEQGTSIHAHASFGRVYVDRVFQSRLLDNLKNMNVEGVENLITYPSKKTDSVYVVVTFTNREGFYTFVTKNHRSKDANGVDNFYRKDFPTYTNFIRAIESSILQASRTGDGVDTLELNPIQYEILREVLEYRNQIYCRQVGNRIISVWSERPYSYNVIRVPIRKLTQESATSLYKKGYLGDRFNRPECRTLTLTIKGYIAMCVSEGISNQIYRTKHRGSLDRLVRRAIKRKGH